MNDNKKLSEERVATYDGESYCNVITGDRVVITRSDKTARLIKTSRISFLERIRNKIVARNRRRKVKSDRHKKY